MLCPKCKEATPLMQGKISAKKLLLDQCKQCNGIWFDKGELEVFLGDKAEKNFNVPEFSTMVPEVKCPRCSIILYEFCYPGTLTLVDGCKQCEGVWLDDKEWKAIGGVRDESNKINCPNCRSRQHKTADSCTDCGIIFNKKKSVNTNSKLKISKVEQSYADDIPGVKGSLLRSIEQAIKYLKADLF